MSDMFGARFRPANPTFHMSDMSQSVHPPVAGAPRALARFPGVSGDEP